MVPDYLVQQSRPCKLARIIADLPDDIRTDIIHAVSHAHRYNATDIARNLRNLKLFVSDRVIQRHRRGECGCG